MQASVEISMYPFRDEPIPPISEFIDRLNEYEGIEVKTNVMSTQIFGDLSTIFFILQKEIDRAYGEGKASFVIKVLKGDVSGMLDE